MNVPLFTGVCTALVTPFLDGKLNTPMLQQLLKRQADSGVKAIVLSGTTGEAPTLSDREKTEMILRAKEDIGDRCLIIAGTGSNSTAHAIELSQQAEEAGADALLVVAPYYNKTNTEGLFAHFMSIAQAVKIPIILYNVPSRTGVDIPVSVYKRLSAIPNIVGVKEASSDITKTARICTSCTDRFFVWSGNDDMIVPSISLGGKGIISVLSNIMPEETVIMTEAALDGDIDTAADLQRRLLPLIDLLFKEVNPIPVKYAMKRIGYDCGNCRLPLAPLSSENKLLLDTYFG